MEPVTHAWVITNDGELYIFLDHALAERFRVAESLPEDALSEEPILDKDFVEEVELRNHEAAD